LYSVDREDPNHDAVMRIGGEAPRRRCPFSPAAWKPWWVAGHRRLGSSWALHRVADADPNLCLLPD